MSKYTLLEQRLGELGMELPLKAGSSNRFLRWGKNSRYWAKAVGEGYIFGDFVSGIKSCVFPDRREPALKERRRIKREEGKIMAEQKKAWDEAAKKAYELWESLSVANSDHPYLIRKHVGAALNVKLHKNCLIIPLVNISGELRTLQFIDEVGNKRFFPGGRKRGCFYLLGDLSQAETVYLCEGYATGMSLNKIVSPVVVCFDAGNLRPVAIDIRRKYPNIPIVICADNDCANDINTGLQKAYEAAMAVNNTGVIYPQLADENDSDIKISVDFNDIDLLCRDNPGLMKGKIEIGVKVRNHDKLNFSPKQAWDVKDEHIKKGSLLAQVNRIPQFTQENNHGK